MEVMRLEYFNSIEGKINSLVSSIEARGRLNLLDMHIHSENLFAGLLNKVYGWNLNNLNKMKSNSEGVDLEDLTAKIIVQVSSTATLEKVKNTLAKTSSLKFMGYTLKFLFIKNTVNSKTWPKSSSSSGITFDPKNDIIDITFLLATIRDLDIATLESVYEFMKLEMKEETRLDRLDCNLTTIVDILSKENLQKQETRVLHFKSFEIQKKIEHNQLIHCVKYINEYKIYCGKLSQIYQEFDMQGANKSLAILNKLSDIYVRALCENNHKDADTLYLKIIDEIADSVRTSRNFQPIPIDELNLCINIIVVDAFIRCKIFENPENYSHVNT